MTERATCSPSQDDAEQGYISGSSESSTDTELEPTVTAQAFQETFAMNEQGVKELLLVPTKSNSTTDLVSIA